MPRKPKVPALRRHKPSKRAVVTLNGDHHYLGAWPDGLAEPPPLVRSAYDALIVRWLNNQRRPLPTLADERRQRTGEAEPDPNLITVAALSLRYVEHARIYYATPDGGPGTEYGDIRIALRPLVHLFSALPAAEIGPLKLKAVRELMVLGYTHPRYGPQPPISRNVVNARVQRIVRMYRWAVTEELLPETVYSALRAVRGLAKGRTTAYETKPILPVPIALVEQTLPAMPSHVAGAARLQLHTGARPGEALRVRLCDIDRSGSIWYYRPPVHKTAWRGDERVLAIGPRAQAVLLEFVRIRCPLCGVEGRPPRLASPDGCLCGRCADTMAAQCLCGPWPRIECQSSDAYLFSPRDCARERHDDRRAARVTPLRSPRTQRQRTNDKRLGVCYRRDAYTAAIGNACLAAGVAHWHPNQLRHTHATEVRRRFGLEAAQVALGHASADITQTYAERDLTLAARVAAEIG